MTDFDTALRFVLASEGGKVNNPKDPGGKTNLGITQATYDAWRLSHGQWKQDVFSITEIEAAAIYRNRYADPIHFDDLPQGVDYCVLDVAVLEGVHHAITDLQVCVGATPDGQIGQITIGRAQQFYNKSNLIDLLCNRRLTFLRSLRTWSTFGRGWRSRVEAVRIHAKSML